MSTAVENLVGLTAPQALGVLLSSLQEVQEVRLAECRPLPALQVRLDFTEAERGVFEKALDLRLRTGLSFWDAALLTLPQVPEAVRLLDAAMVHVSFRGRERRLAWASAIAGGIERACAGFSAASDANLAFLSEVVCCGGLLRHLPMVDFHASKSDPNRRIVTAVAERIFPRGAILLESGESYHAYGTELLSESDFRTFIGRALLFAPIVDRAYLAHQLIEGRCALRLTPGAVSPVRRPS
jgi:hypothetical protein